MGSIFKKICKIYNLENLQLLSICESSKGFESIFKAHIYRLHHTNISLKLKM